MFALRNLRCNLLMFLNNIELKIENKNSRVGKKTVVSNLWKKNGFIYPLNDFEKSLITKKSKSWKHECICFFLQMNIMNIIRHFFSQSETTLSKQYFLTFILFSILSSILSRNRCKLRHKLRKAKIYTLEVKNSDVFQISIQISLILFFFSSSFSLYFKLSKTYNLCVFLKPIDAIRFWKPKMKNKKL